MRALTLDLRSEDEGKIGDQGAEKLPETGGGCDPQGGTQSEPSHAKIEVESKTLDFEGLHSAFMLSRINARIQLLHHLSGASEEQVWVEHFGIVDRP